MINILCFMFVFLLLIIQSRILNLFLIFDDVILMIDFRIHFVFQIISSIILISFNSLLNNEFLVLQFLKHFLFKRIVSHKVPGIVYFPTLNNNYFDFGSVIYINGSLRYLSYHLHPFNYLSKYNMFTIQMWTCFQSDEKLTIV